MKKDVKKRFKKTAGRLKNWINPSAWVGFDRLKKSTAHIREEALSIFSMPSAKREEQFDEALNRLGIERASLLKKQKTLLWTTGILCFCSILAFTYAIYELMSPNFRAFFPSLMLGLLSLAVAFRYHFWYFQMKSEKLGCSFQEWLTFVKNCFIGKK